MVKSLKLGFDETVELLSNILPARALGYLRNYNVVDSQVLSDIELNDKTVLTMLDESGIRRYQIIRNSIAEILESKGESIDVSDVFSLVDPEFRDKNNPFIETVKSLLQNLLTH